MVHLQINLSNLFYVVIIKIILYCSYSPVCSLDRTLTKKYQVKYILDNPDVTEEFVQFFSKFSIKHLKSEVFCHFWLYIEPRRTHPHTHTHICTSIYVQGGSKGHGQTWVSQDMKSKNCIETGYPKRDGAIAWELDAKKI